MVARSESLRGRDVWLMSPVCARGLTHPQRLALATCELLPGCAQTLQEGQGAGIEELGTRVTELEQGLTNIAQNIQGFAEVRLLIMTSHSVGNCE